MRNVILNALIGAAGQILLRLLSEQTDKATFNLALVLAREQVAKLMNVDLAKEEKRKAAIAQVKTDLLRVGRNLREVMIAIAVEMAVAELKSAVK